MVTINFLGWLKDIVRCKSSFIINKSENEKKIIYQLNRRTSIKDVIESLGIPHTEVGCLYNASKVIHFSYILQRGDHISVIPHNVPIDKNNYLFLEPLKELKFIVDVNVGKLARFLRLLGYDCAFNWKWNDEEIAQIAYREKRILLSRDIQLLKRKKVLWGKLIQNTDPLEQLKEVVELFDLKIKSDSFTRCIVCNKKLVKVDKKSIIHRLEPKTKKYFNDFSLCPKCNRIYWAGSHVENMKKIIRNL